MDMDMESIDLHLYTAMEEAARLGLLDPGNSSDSDSLEAPSDPSTSLSFKEYIEDMRSSQTYAVMDRAYDSPPFPSCTHLIQDMRGNPKWTTLRLFAFLKGKMLSSDSLDAKADYLRTIIMYIRDNKLLPSDYTSELAVSRILAGLAHKREFRDRLYRMRRCRNAFVFCEPFYEVLAYICYNHANPHGSREAKRRRVIVPDDVPLPPRCPTPPADDGQEALVPPPYRARLYRTSIEEHYTEDWGTPIREVAFAAYLELRRLTDRPDVLDHHVGAVQAILKIINDKYPEVKTPYFDNISDADLRAAFARDAAFMAALDELKRRVDNLVQDRHDGKLLDVVRRLVNHFCQPLKRTRNSTRNVRFAPY
ncbi:hypothetical protein AURDEDRAFT_152950 [Auricularia subglabra TFB-10046 SS5]|nr:hypothetical protein AURDEDRAFT_152950 [Auricularia subglabra TFB-10046 SS5]